MSLIFVVVVVIFNVLYLMAHRCTHQDQLVIHMDLPCIVYHCYCYYYYYQ